jgi:hypothetical protein
LAFACDKPIALASSGPDGALFFDDFNYADPAGLVAGGWTVRQQVGHPGIPGASWGLESVNSVEDSDRPGNRFLRLLASTDGTPSGTRQAQVCHARKYFEGTYAARIRLTDEPIVGPDGDVVVESFYVVSPLQHDFDPEFSEVDWEYLPNGGWGDGRTRLYSTSWQTVRIEPWKAYNQAHEEFHSVAGWHTFVMQIADGRTRHYLDGLLLATHGGRNYPVVPMSINFNIWFSPGGTLAGTNARRTYQQDVDWVFHAKDQVLQPASVEAMVAEFRKLGQSRADTVAPPDKPLPNLCNF